MLSLFSPRKWPFFYGYWIVVCTVLGLAMSAPGQTIGVSVFTDALIEHLGLTRLSLSTTYMVGTVLSSLLIVRVGSAIDRRGARWVAASAAVGLGLTLVVLSQVDHVARKLPALLGLVTVEGAGQVAFFETVDDLNCASMLGVFHKIEYGAFDDYVLQIHFA